MSDSAISNMESNRNSSEPAEVNSKAFGEDTNSVLSDAQVDTVLHFISSPPMHGDTPHFISSSHQEDVSTPLSDNGEISVETDVCPEVLTPVVKYQQIGLPPAGIDLLLDDDVAGVVQGNSGMEVTNVGDDPANLLESGGEEKVEGVADAVVVPSSRASVGAHLATDVSSVSDRVVKYVEDDLSSGNIPTEETSMGDRVGNVETNIPLAKANDTSQADELSRVSVDGGKEVAGDDVKTEEVSVKDLESLGELDLSALDLPLQGSLASRNLQVQLKSEAERLVIILPSESQLAASDYSWSEIWQQLKQRLNAGDRLRVANSNVHLVASDRLLDARQLQELAESLNEVQLQLKSVATSRRQTAIASVTSGYSVEQLQLQSKSLSSLSTIATPLAEPLCMEMTVRSGVEIRHPGTVIVLGDVNPGGIVVADGDILVWGRLRGVAHAGASGNNDCLIMALQMEPTQLRIADAVARSPEKLPKQFHAEVAYITDKAIRIAKAADFSRSNRIK